MVHQKVIDPVSWCLILIGHAFVEPCVFGEQTRNEQRSHAIGMFTQLCFAFLVLTPKTSGGSHPSTKNKYPPQLGLGCLVFEQRPAIFRDVSGKLSDFTKASRFSKNFARVFTSNLGCIFRNRPEWHVPPSVKRWSSCIHRHIEESQSGIAINWAVGCCSGSWYNQLLGSSFAKYHHAVYLFSTLQLFAQIVSPIVSSFGSYHWGVTQNAALHIPKFWNAERYSA